MNLHVRKGIKASSGKWEKFYTKGFVSDDENVKPHFRDPFGSCDKLLEELQCLLRVGEREWKDEIKACMVQAYLEGQLGDSQDKSKKESQERNNIPRCFLSCLTYALVWVRLITNPTLFLYPDGGALALSLPDIWKLLVVSE